MTQLLPRLALVVTAAGVVAAAVSLATTRDWRASLAVLTEMLTAAGLLRLAEPPSVQVTAAAALIILIRKLAVVGLDPDGLARLLASVAGPRRSRRPSAPVPYRG